jgi:enoyl reductase-like protein
LGVQVENLEARLKMVEVAKTASEFQIDDSQLSRTRELLRDIESRIEVDAQLFNAEDFITDEIQLDDPQEKAGILERITEYEETRSPSSATYVGVAVTK